MVEAVETAGVTCFPFQGIMRLRMRRPQGAHRRAARSARSPCCTRPAAGRSPRTRYNSGKPGWFADPRHVPGGALIDEGIYWIDFFRWLAEQRIVRVEAQDGESGPQGHRRRGLGHGDVHVRERPRSPRSKRRGRSTRRGRPGRRRSRTASSGSKSSGRAARSSTSGSARPAARCSPPAPRTGCSSGSPSRRSPLPAPFPAHAPDRLPRATTSSRPPRSGMRGSRSSWRWRHTNRPEARTAGDARMVTCRRSSGAHDAPCTDRAPSCRGDSACCRRPPST